MLELPAELIEEIYYMLPVRDRRALTCTAKSIILPKKIEWTSIQPNYELHKEYVHLGERLYEDELNALVQLQHGNNAIVCRDTDRVKVALIAAYCYNIQVKSVCVILEGDIHDCPRYLPRDCYEIASSRRRIKMGKIIITTINSEHVEAAIKACDITISTCHSYIPGALCIMPRTCIAPNRYDPPRITTIRTRSDVKSSYNTIVTTEANLKKTIRYANMRCNGNVTVIVR